MTTAYQVVVCAGIVPDPLQTLEPVALPAGPALKNEMMLPAVLDPWAGHALYEAANLAKKMTGSKVWLVSLGPKAKLQQVMMTVAQKVPFELVALDGPSSGFTDAFEVSAFLAKAIEGIVGLFERGTPEPTNIGNPVEFSVLQLAEQVLRLTGSRSPIVREPLPEDDPKVRQPDITRAHALLGWEAKVPLAEGLARTVAYFRAKLK